MALWFFAVAFYTVYKEYNLRHGTTVMLKVVPVDPRDLFRGDYVILDYEISRPKEGQRVLGPYGNYIEDEPLHNNDTVYVELIKDGSYHKGGNIYKSRPKKGLFIKGTAKNKSSFFGFGGSNFTIIYGIESFFVQESKGLEIEKSRDKNDIAVEVAINSLGTATIKKLHIASLSKMRQ